LENTDTVPLHPAQAKV